MENVSIPKCKAEAIYGLLNLFEESNAKNGNPMIASELSDIRKDWGELLTKQGCDLTEMELENE